MRIYYDARADGLLDSRQSAELVSTLLFEGGVLLPSDTGYAWAADPCNGTAIRRLNALLRHGNQPIPLTVSSPTQAKTLIRLTPAHQRMTADAWPGPLTVVSKAWKDGRKLAALLGNGVTSDTLGVRCGTCPTEWQLLAETRFSLTSAAVRYPNGEIVRDFDDAYDIIEKGIEGMNEDFPWQAVRGRKFAFTEHSTVAALTEDGLLDLLRAGAWPERELHASLRRRGPGEYAEWT